MDDADCIKFNCQHCGGKIRVPKIHAGKKGKCPKCDHVITIPFESAAMELQCKYCGLKISVPQNFIGKDGFCPKCKSPVVTQAEPDTGSDTEQKNDTDPRTRLVGAGGNLTLLDVPEEYKLKDEPIDLLKEPVKITAQEPEISQETEPAGHRKLPWIVDIFLYPMSFAGLLHLGIFAVIPFLIGIAITLLGPLGIVIGLPGLIINIAIGFYMYWYLSECIHDSTKGGTRAPDAFSTIDLSEMWSQALHILACCLIIFAPVIIYYSITQSKSSIYWLLLICGIFFFPMGLLSTVMFDSIRGLNPILLIGSIFSTFFQYCGLVLFFAGIVLVMIILPDNKPEDEQIKVYHLFLDRVIYLITLYLTFVLAHLLGRFYWRNQEKLNWEA